MSICPPWLRATVAFLLLLLAPLRAHAQDAEDAVVDKMTQMNKDAVAAYQAKNYEEARKILKKALDAASAAKLDAHPITARTHIHLGVVIIVGFSQRALGIKQFKKALEIQPDINLTKALVTPELAEAFAEAKSEGKSGGKGAGTAGAVASTDGKPPSPPVPPPGPAAAPKPAPPSPAVAPPASPPPAAPAPSAALAPSAPPAPPVTPLPLGGEEAANGLVHEAVTEAKQGSAISITVAVQGDLQFERLVLAYRPDGGSEFLGREMKSVSDGQYGAEIPPGATSGSVVSYYIEAEDADGGLVAARGSADAPLVIHLVGVGAARHETREDDDEDEAPARRYFLGLMAGSGFGWATGEGDTNKGVAINPSGLAVAGVGQIAPEFGYWVTSSLLISGQIRYEVITGTNDIYTADSQIHHTANYALAVFSKATWRYGEGAFHPFFSLAAGGGRIRHVINYGHQLTDCGPKHNETCVDTIGAGPVLLGPGAGIMYDFGDRTSLVLQVNSTLGFPTFSVNFDGNVGVAFGF